MSRFLHTMRSPWLTAALGILITWCAFASIIPMNLKYLAASGLSGDSFGVLTSLFGGMTLLGVAYAAYLQRKELRRAYRDARKSDKEREASLASQERLADAMQLTAELTAINSTYNSYNNNTLTNGISQSIHPHLDFGNISRRRDRTLQLSQARMTEMRTPRFVWDGVPLNEQTWVRRYYLTLMRDRDRRCCAISRRNPGIFGTAEGVRDMLVELNHELIILSDQDGVAGSPDEAIIADAFGQLNPIVVDLERRLNPEFTDLETGWRGRRGYQLIPEDWRRIYAFFRDRGTTRAEAWPQQFVTPTAAPTSAGPGPVTPAG